MGATSKSTIRKITAWPRGGTVDTADLKSASGKPECRFESGRGHHIEIRSTVRKHPQMSVSCRYCSILPPQSSVQRPAKLDDSRPFCWYIGGHSRKIPTRCTNMPMTDMKCRTAKATRSPQDIGRRGIAPVGHAGWLPLLATRVSVVGQTAHVSIRGVSGSVVGRCARARDAAKRHFADDTDPSAARKERKQALP